MPTIYALRCDQNKWYIGKTDRPVATDRIIEHFNGTGAKWTQKYKPIAIDRVWEGCDSFDEDKYTKMYMAKYGIDNVRGGSYVQIELDPDLRKFLQRELFGASDLCFKCGERGHFVANCQLNGARPEVKTYNNIEPEVQINTATVSNAKPELKTDIKQDEDENDGWVQLMDEKGPGNGTMDIININDNKPTPGLIQTISKTITYQITDSNSMFYTIAKGIGTVALALAVAAMEGQGECSRCGYSSHTSTNCYARRHKDGRKLR